MHSINSQFIDITLPLSATMPFWPGSTGVNLIEIKRMEKGETDNLSRLDLDLHAGTHLDAPWHFIKNGKTVESIPLQKLMGPAFVAYLPETSLVSEKDLETINLPKGTKRLLLRTRNSDLWRKKINHFVEDFVGLSPEAADWIVQKDILLVGIDYLSIQPFGGSAQSHSKLLEKEIVIVEGLNLTNVTPGSYELFCLPIKIIGAEGAPVRAVLRKLEGTK